jgi:SAM-dependent methyltransferase
MDIIEIRKHWYAYIYDQEVMETDDIDFLLEIIGKEPKNILEACCGTGRILVPIAKVGHKATGFDVDEYAVARISEKTIDMNNIKYYQLDALRNDWGNNYDVVVLAGNVMMNIETDGDYEYAQKMFIKRASDALKRGGYIYLDFDLHSNPENIYEPTPEERVVFEGYDDRGTYGKYIICVGGVYDKDTQMAYGKRKIELVLQNGEKNIYEYNSNKRIPKLAEIREWLKANNFEIEQEYGNKNKEPISNKTHRATIYAKKI